MIDLKKFLITNSPYFIVGALATNIGEGLRLSEGINASEKFQSLLLDGNLINAFKNPLPSLYPFDLLIGALAGLILWLLMYLKKKNAKHFKHGVEYGSARWGTSKDIEPYMNPKFEENVILSRTERITMESRPKNPKYALNKNVLVLGGSGSGKTRFFIKPNILQENSSVVVTDPKGTVNLL